MAQVNVLVRVRDMTRGDLDRINRRFNDLGDSFNRFANNRSVGNLNALRDSVQGMGDDLQRLRGRIPEDEFRRLSQASDRLRTSLNSIGPGTSDRRIGQLRTMLRDLDDQMNRVNQRATINLRVRNDTRRGLRDADGDINRFTRRITGILPNALGDTFSDGVGQALARAFYAAASNPAVAAAVSFLIVSMISMLGAAIGGALILAVGGAIVGLGGFIAAQSEQVKTKFSAALAELKPLFRDAAKPMIPVLEHGIDLMEEMGKKFAPHFETALEESAPFLTDFMDHVAKGFEKFGEIAFKPIMSAFNALLEEFGPQFEGFMASLGESFKTLAESVEENKEAVALALRIVLEIIPLIIDILAGLVEVWGTIVERTKDFIAMLEILWGYVKRGWDFSMRVDAPGLGQVIASVQTLWDWVNRNWFRSVEFRAPGIGMITDLVQTLWAWVDRNWFRSVGFRAPGISMIIDLVQTLWGWVDRNWSRTIALNVTTSGLDTLSNLLPFFAHGGIRGLSAAATGGIRSNMTMVGEHGPEIVNLPPGSHVRSNSDTRRLLQDDQNGGRNILEVRSSGAPEDDFLVEWMRRAVHARGGNVQLVFGRN